MPPQHDVARITDLADPTFTPDVRELMAAGSAIGRTIEMTSDALLTQAMQETGLQDFGTDPTFIERVEVVVGALRDEAGLSSFGRVTTVSQLVQLLKNRLLVVDLLDRHPEIHDVPIERPIVIAGLPRTGTTHLHNLLAADPRLRSLPYWESLEPVLPETELGEPGSPDPRRTRTEAGLAILDAALPYFRRMHEMTVDHVHEEIQLLAIDFSSMLFETTSAMPSLRDYYLAHDQTPHYEFLKTMLKVLTWSRGGTRWLLKSPQHIEQFPALLSVFPDATVLVTHRDPVSVTASMCTMIAYTARLHLESVDPVRLGRYWSDRIERMLRACVDERDVLPAGQSIDIAFDAFMADDLRTVHEVYELADQPFDDRTQAAITAYRDSHERGRHGGVHYELADFGLDPAERRDALAFYVERFLGR